MPEPFDSKRIFVYGTLKRGYCRHFVLAGQRFLGEARTAPAYRLVRVGSYPTLVQADKKGLSIVGELWEVDRGALIELDGVEGTDVGLFERRPIRIEAPWNTIAAEAYFYVADASAFPDCGTVWDDPATRID